MNIQSFSRDTTSKDPASLASSLNRLSGDNKTSREEKLKKLKEASKDFESIFVHSLMKAMRSTIQKSDFINGGNAENIYQDMLDDEYSKTVVKRADFGIAKKIYEQLSKTIK